MLELKLKIGTLGYKMLAQLKQKLEAKFDYDAKYPVQTFDANNTYYSTDSRKVPLVLTEEETTVLNKWLERDLPMVFRLAKRMYSAPSAELCNILKEPLSRISQLDLEASWDHKNFLKTFIKWVNSWVSGGFLITDGHMYDIESRFTDKDCRMDDNINWIMYFSFILRDLTVVADEINAAMDADSVDKAPAYKRSVKFDIYDVQEQSAIDFYNGMDFILTYTEDDPNFYYTVWSDLYRWSEETYCDMNQLKKYFEDYPVYFYARVIWSCLDYLHKYLVLPDRSAELQEGIFGIRIANYKKVKHQLEIWNLPVPHDRLVYKEKSFTFYIPLILEMVAPAWGQDANACRQEAYELMISELTGYDSRESYRAYTDLLVSEKNENVSLSENMTQHPELLKKLYVQLWKQYHLLVRKMSNIYKYNSYMASKRALGWKYSEEMSRAEFDVANANQDVTELGYMYALFLMQPMRCEDAIKNIKKKKRNTAEISRAVEILRIVVDEYYP